MSMKTVRRGIVRAVFTKTYNILGELLKNESVEIVEAASRFKTLESKYLELVALNEEIRSELYTGTAQDQLEQTILAEFESSDEYDMKYLRAKARLEALTVPVNVVNMGANSTSSDTLDPKARHKKLPKLEFRQFGGEISQWVAFWSQFSGVHDDDTLIPEDKFQYLIQATTPGSRARKIVESFPPSGKNYEKAVDSLKERFGRHELLIEHYTRELLRLVVNNRNMKLDDLYDSLSTQVNALETLDVVLPQYGAFLLPLVESCVPSEVLRVWQRSITDRSAPFHEKLKDLLDFLRREVEGEEKIKLSESQLGTQAEMCDPGGPPVNPQPFGYSTATDLANLSIDSAPYCVFCTGKHPSADCRKALNISREEKLSVLRRAGRCFSCTKRGHPASRCRAQCSECNGHHVPLMCSRSASGEESKPQKAGAENAVKSKNESDLLSVNHSLTVSASEEVYLQTFSVTLYNNEVERRVRVLVDSGSQRSYILNHLASEMKFEEIGEESLVHSLFGGCTMGLIKHSCYKAKIRSIDRDYACRFTVLAQSTIASFIPVASIDADTELELKENDIKLIEDEAGPIEILIGADVAGKIWSGKRVVLSSGLVAVETTFGWTLMGTKKQAPVVRCSTNLATTFTMTTVASGDVTDLWKLEAIGISDPVEKEQRDSRRQAVLDHFKSTLEFVNGRYQVRLPWFGVASDLPNNRALTERRTLQTTKRVCRNDLYEEYDAVFREWLRLNIVEIAEDDNKGHYLPHRPVLKDTSTTTKVRPVFDASAKMAGFPSLNDCLEQGPNLIELLPDILMRFRDKAIGISADVEKAFLQIGIHPDDREYLKFFWWNSEDQMITMRHARVVFGITCSPFLLAAVLDFHLRKCAENGNDEDSKTLELLRKSFYVDNLATSVDSMAEAKGLQSMATDALKRGGFNLRGWEFSHDECNRPSNLLGLKWNRERDTLSINMDWWEKVSQGLSSSLTKRNVLSLTQRIYDPIGLCGPAILNLKLMLQSLWDLELDWDDPLDDDTAKAFKKWLRCAPRLKEIAVRRNLGTNINRSLHLFCDASSKAYAACVFLRSETENGEIIVSLIQAKSRVAPSKAVTMPRLELMGATIGARLLKSVREAMDADSVPTYAWCDSSTVVAWIQREEEWSVFVRNRIKEIRSLTRIDEWRHIPGSMNPADCPSREFSIDQLVDSQWWEGPSWLREKEELWPSSRVVFVEHEVGSERLKKSSTVMVGTSYEKYSWLYKHFNGYERIIRMVGWILRFKHNSLHPDEKKIGQLCVEELEHSERLVLSSVQEESFPSLDDERIKKLNPLKDDSGLMRVRTRLTEKDDELSFTTPIILPNDHPMVRRLVEYHHTKAKHVGAHTLWTILREKFWILRGRQLTRSVVRKCVTCRRFDGNSFDAETPPLPRFRVDEAAIFQICGIDYAGPLYLRDGKKAWIALFTCGVYRAVHLEIVTSLSTESFLLALRRFIARRGRPSVIYSDNATCFHGADSLMGDLEWNKIQEYCSLERIHWRFNPPTASWWGGFYERMVQTVKRLLRRILGKAALDLDELYTTLCECESLVNSRPITISSEDNRDPVALTPAAFLQEIKCSDTVDLDSIEANSLDRRLQYRHEIRRQLRARFRLEYLGTLKWIHRKDTREPIIGEIVLVGSDDTKRLNWPLARVEGVERGVDNRVRIVHLRTEKGVLTRPLQRVFPLEIFVEPGEGKGSAEGQSEELEEDGEGMETLEPEEDRRQEDGTTPEPVGDSHQTRRGRIVKPPQRLDLLCHDN